MINSTSENPSLALSDCHGCLLFVNKAVAMTSSRQMPVTTGLENVPSVRLPVNLTTTPLVLSFESLPVAVTTKAVLVPLQAYVKLVLSVTIFPA